MELMEIILNLENEMSDRRGLFGKKIDIDKCLDLVDIMKKTYPESLREANYVVANKQKILENADSVAKNTIREAEERAEHIIDNSELIRKAEIEAKQIIETAYMQCDTLIQGTKDHLDSMFKDIEQFLLSTLSMIRNNREELRGAMIISNNKR